MNNNRYRYVEKKSHDEHLENLLLRPHLIGINEPVKWCAKQMLLYKEDNTGLLTDIDLIYRTPSDIWVAEYKTTPGYLSKAKKQIEAAKVFVKEHFSTVPRALYVVGPKYERFEL
jgi:hypothetical protein